MMEQKQVVPPFKPNISGKFVLDKFNPQFTTESVIVTPDDNVRNIGRYEFADFKCINYLSMYEK